MEPYPLYLFDEAQYRNCIQSLRFLLPHRYDYVKWVGQGGYGSVIKAIDRRENTIVAIKRIRETTKSILHAKRALREISFLAAVNHPNIVRMLACYTPAAHPHELSDVYIVMESMDDTIDKATNVAGQPNVIAFIVYQLVVAIRYLHLCGLTHRDLKPVNIGANEERCVLKLLDFGLARTLNSEMSGYVNNRFWRSPEILFGLPYDQQADVWSVGCVILEVIMKRPFFLGANAGEMYRNIAEKIGSPSAAFINRLPENVATVVKSRGKTPAQPWEVLLPDRYIGDHERAKLLRDLLSKMLRFDRHERITMDEALEHPSIAFYQRADEVNVPAVALDDSFETLNNMEDLTKELFRRVKILQEQTNFQRD